jgi:hypothetical protein
MKVSFLDSDGEGAELASISRELLVGGMLSTDERWRRFEPSWTPRVRADPLVTATLPWEASWNYDG